MAKCIFCFSFHWVWKSTGSKACSFKNYICRSILTIHNYFSFSFWSIWIKHLRQLRSAIVAQAVILRCSENMQQIYRRTLMPFQWSCSNLIKIVLRHGCSPVNLLHIFRTPFPKNISGRLLLTYTLIGCELLYLHLYNFVSTWKGLLLDMDFVLESGKIWKATL